MSFKFKDNASDIRTDLGLGTSAIINVGTGANQVVQLDSNAKLPAVDGSAMTGIGGNLPVFAGRLINTVSGINGDTDYNLGTNFYQQANLPYVNGGSVWNSTTGRFTPDRPGKYFVKGQGHFDAGGGNFQAIYVMIRKNGTTYISSEINEGTSNANEQSLTVEGIIPMNGTTDYLELWMNVSTAADNRTIAGRQAYFHGFYLFA